MMRARRFVGAIQRLGKGKRRALAAGPLRIRYLPKVTNETPRADEILAIKHQGKVYWIILRCPCGCGEVITLPAQSDHSKSWALIDKSEGPTIYPSIWRNQGCMSHFWIRDGTVEWTIDTGMAPWVAKPLVYKRPSVR
jgi:hypothetical protein